MNEAIRAVLIRTAAELLMDGYNPEYRRGIVETIAYATQGAEADEVGDAETARWNVERDLIVAIAGAIDRLRAA